MWSCLHNVKFRRAAAPNRRSSICFKTRLAGHIGDEADAQISCYCVYRARWYAASEHRAGARVSSRIKV